MRLDKPIEMNGFSTWMSVFFYEFHSKLFQMVIQNNNEIAAQYCNFNCSWFFLHFHSAIIAHHSELNHVLCDHLCHCELTKHLRIDCLSRKPMAVRREYEGSGHSIVIYMKIFIHIVFFEESMILNGEY